MDFPSTLQSNQAKAYGIDIVSSPPRGNSSFALRDFHKACISVSTMVTISPRSRMASSRRPGRIAVYLMIGMLILFSFVMANIMLVSVTDSTNSLRGQPQILQELDVARSVEVADSVNITLENEEAESKSSAPTGSPTYEVAAAAAAAAATTTITTTTTTTASTIPIRDMILKRSLEVKKFVMEKFAGSYNSPINPRYHQTSTSPKTAPRSLSCDQEDAFAGVPIDNGRNHAWLPSPSGGYSHETLSKWETSFDESMKRIGEETAGGDKLREFAEKEVKQLRQLRHSLVCKRP